jgi:hypothetical protein
LDGKGHRRLVAEELVAVVALAAVAAAALRQADMVQLRLRMWKRQADRSISPWLLAAAAMQ